MNLKENSCNVQLRTNIILHSESQTTKWRNVSKIHFWVVGDFKDPRFSYSAQLLRFGNIEAL